MAKRKDIEVEVAEVVDFLRLTGKFTPALREVVMRKITVEAAKDAGIKVSDGELQKAADVFRSVNGLAKASDTEAWLKENGIALQCLEDYLEANLLINKFRGHLEKKAPRKKYLASPGIQESITEMAFQEWLSKALK